MVATLVVFGQEFAVGSEDISTAATVLLAIVGFMILYRISKPLNWMRWTRPKYIGGERTHYAEDPEMRK